MVFSELLVDEKKFLYLLLSLRIQNRAVLPFLYYNTEELAY